MSDVFISYARSTEREAKQVFEALRALGCGVWLDDELPAHRDYSDVIEERLRAAKAVVVVWSADAAKSQWVRAEADLAREVGTLVQLTVDGAALKGVEPKAAAALGIVRTEPGGELWGKRCGMSENINRSARRGLK